MLTDATLASIVECLAHDRMGTYERAAAAAGRGPGDALDLYEWNAVVASAFQAPLHLFEVILRNAIDAALVATYGPNWSTSRSFVASVPGTHRRLVTRSGRQREVAHDVAQTPFAFWEHMLTTRYTGRIWDRQFDAVFPARPPGPVRDALASLHDDVRTVRRFRNRIAHHEPIFARALDDDIRRIERVIALRGDVIAWWVAASHPVTEIIAQRPAWSAMAVR